MSKIKLIGVSLTACGVLCGLLSAQDPQNQNGNPVLLTSTETPVYRLSLTPRTVKAINYRHRGSTTNRFPGNRASPKCSR